MCSLSEVYMNTNSFRQYCVSIVYFSPLISELYPHGQTLQQLTTQLKEARDQKTHYESECHRLLVETRTAGVLTGELHESTGRHWQGRGEDVGDVERVKTDLERVEGELFEARMQLQTKVNGWRSNVHCTIIYNRFVFTSYHHSQSSCV